MQFEMTSKIDRAGRRCAELLHRVSVSQAIVSSALELPRVSVALEEQMHDWHLSGETGVRDILTEYKLIVPIKDGEPFDADKIMPLVARALAKQTVVNAGMVISAAVVILSHSTADDVFTEVCKLAIDLDSSKWAPLLNPQRTVTLKSLKEKGFEVVFEEELEQFKAQIGNKSLPNRAKILFERIPILMNSQIPSNDPAYFKMSKLEEGDKLRIELVHRNGLPGVDAAAGANFAEFLHEAAKTAVRSLGAAYGIPWDMTYWNSLLAPKIASAPSKPDLKPSQ